ncbi:MAG: Trk system potassium transporter TrkA [Actinobacteria bacterium]|nr:Trk system potassium transporter TrkA [Actinomycetota bacterium]
MKIIVVGTGTLGFYVARKLSEERHDVVLVGDDAEALRRAQDEIDVGAVVGKGSTPSILLEAGLRSADILVAVTGSDETNIVACLIAETVARKIVRVARLHDPAYLGAKGIIDKSSLSIDLVISPEEEVAHAVAVLASTPGATDVLEFAGGRVKAVGVEIDADSPMIGKPIKDLTRRAGEKLLVAGVYRGELVSAPSADIRLMAGDTLFLVADRPSVRRAMTRLGKRWARTRNVVIVGGGWEGVSIARRLAADGVHTKIIERDPAVCEEIASLLDDTLVLNGDGMDERLLKDEGVQRAEMFVAALGNETDNIFAALLARRLGARRVAALIDTPEYMPFASTIGVDIVLSPLLSALNPILQLSRQGQVISVSTLREELVEGIEFVAVKGAGIVGLPLALLHMPHGSLVGAVVRDDEVIIPDSATVVEEGDRVVLFARPALLPRLQRLLTPS